MFGLAAIPVMLSVGAAVDYSFANRTKAVLDGIADATSLSAVGQSALAISAKTEQKDAVKFFKAQAASLKRGSLGTVKVKVTDNSSGRTAVVTYTASVPTAFMGIIGYNNIDISGSSTAASAIPTYIDFYLLLDNTPSMGVGATPADVATMVANTPDQCAFACHEMDISPNDYYGLAKKLGVTTRIDVVRSATQQLMDTANVTQTVPNQFRAAIYTFGASAASAGLTKIFPLSSSLSSAKTAAANIDLMTVPYQNYASDTDTDFDTVLPAIDSLIASPGDGYVAVVAAENTIFRVRWRGRRQHRRLFAADQRGQGPADRAELYALPGAAQCVVVHGHESARHQDRRALHHLFGAADQRLVHELDRPVQQRALWPVDQQPDRQEHGELRVAGLLFRGQPDRRDFAGDDRAVPESGDGGAHHALAVGKSGRNAALEQVRAAGCALRHVPACAR